MHSSRLGITIALLTCGLGWSKSVNLCNGATAVACILSLQVCIKSFRVLEIH